METLKERVFSYEETSDIRLMKKVPLLIVINGRSFRKTTSLLDKPYSRAFSDVMGKVLIKLASDIDGATFLYSFNDEIVIVCQNNKNLETEAWYDNNLQKIVSVSSSLATQAFNYLAQDSLKLLGDSIFAAKAFIVPFQAEAINYLIAKQHQASNNAISMLFFYELTKKYSGEKADKISKNLSIEEKYNLLIEEYNVDIKSYPLAFWRGIACYRIPKLIKTIHGEEFKNKLIVNDELPFFKDDQNFIGNILKR